MKMFTFLDVATNSRNHLIPVAAHIQAANMVEAIAKYCASYGGWPKAMQNVTAVVASDIPPVTQN